MSSSSTTSDPSALPGEAIDDDAAESMSPTPAHDDTARQGEKPADDLSTEVDVPAEADVPVEADVSTEADESTIDAPSMSHEGLVPDAPTVPDTPNPAQPAIPDMNPAACAAELRKRFPALFAGAVKPLKLRIQQDIQERAPGVFSKTTLTGFFRRHTRSTPYLMALSKATHRIDLDGQQAGELSEEHRVAATEELVRRRANQDARRAEEQAQHQAAHAAEQARRAETEAAQRQRASLLRDFQATTLTLANFCALKGLEPEALEPMLAQARVEAEERAKNPPPMQRPHVDGRTNPRSDGREGRGDPRRDARGGPRSGPGNGGPGGPGGSRNGGGNGGNGAPAGSRDAGRPGGSGGPRNAGGPRNGPPGGRQGERGPRNAGAPQGGHRNGLVGPKPSNLAADGRRAGEQPKVDAGRAEVDASSSADRSAADARPTGAAESQAPVVSGPASAD